MENLTWIEVQRNDITQRKQFLWTIKKIHDEGSTTVYLDVTWVDTNHTKSHQWIFSNESQNRGKKHLGKGQRFVVFHAGCEKGFLQGCDLVVNGMSTDERDL